jgi:NAD(P)-dependent dehydrogenase (short-subunit alcohol dehydrogenase family)
LIHLWTFRTFWLPISVNIEHIWLRNMSAADIAKDALKILPTAGLAKDVIDLLEKKLALITDEVWDHFVELNLWSCMALTRALVPRMTDRKWGRVIHISSIDPRAQRFSRRNTNCEHHRQSNQQ